MTRFLDRARQRKASWLRPMKVAGRKLAKRILANLDAEGKLP